MEEVLFRPTLTCRIALGISPSVLASSLFIRNISKVLVCIRIALFGVFVQLDMKLPSFFSFNHSFRPKVYFVNDRKMAVDDEDRHLFYPIVSPETLSCDSLGKNLLGSSV